jgi:pimeloyl-ACP methyl ester carboxylesterase
VSTFVLVEGAWHGGWCWRKVAPLLRAAGHDAYAATLTGLGERLHLASPAIDLTTHIQDVANVLEYEDLREVVLVGHSYGGMVITGVAERAAQRLAHLVYLDAFVPADGQSVVDLIGPEGRQFLEARVQAEGDGWRLPSITPVPWEVVVREMWGIADEADARWMVARLCPQPFKTFTEPVRRTNPGAAAVGRTFIRCTGDPPDPTFARPAEEARRPNSGWHYREVASPHDAMITAPREVTDLLREVVGT